jgi:adhesin/invasin
MFRRSLVIPLLLAACTGEPGGPPTGPSTLTVVAHAGADQVAIGNTAVAVAPAVRITDANGPREGVQVEFTILEGGGVITGHLVSTDADGVARVGSWTLGDPGVTQLLNARVGLARTSLIFDAEAITGPYHWFEPEYTPLHDQEYELGVEVSPPIRVIATDRGGNPVAGVPVTWMIDPGQGTLSGFETVTDASGIARGGSWRLTTRAGLHRVEVRPDVAGSLTRSFVVRTRPGPAAVIEPITPAHIVAAPGSNVSAPPRIRVRDQYGNLVSARQAIFEVTEGGGSVDNTHQILAADGTAGVMRWTLGPNPGTHRLTVRVDQATATFTATTGP